MDENQHETEVTIPFDQICKKFVRQIQGIRDTFPMVMLLISANSAKAGEELLDFLNSKGPEKQKVTLENEDIHVFHSLDKNATTALTAKDIIPQSLFVSMISQFDSFLGDVIRTIFDLRPEILNSSDKNLTFARLLQLKSIEEAKEFIVEKEVESVIRESHSSHFDWLESKIGIPLRKDLPIWATFIEMTERRNLFVHRDGHVSSQYLAVCRNNMVTFEKELNLDDKLSVNPEYFGQSFRCLFEISVKLTQVIWRKLLPNDLDHADRNLNSICFELLRNKEYNLANILLDFATTVLKKHHSAESMAIFTVIKAIAMKFGDVKGGCDHYLKNLDWSAFNDRFKLAKEVLLGNFEECVKIMKKIGPDGEISRADYKVWPLFSEFKETGLFQNAYKEYPSGEPLLSCTDGVDNFVRKEWSKITRSRGKCLPALLPGRPANFLKRSGAGSRG